jgi:hypothetical protein
VCLKEQKFPKAFLRAVCSFQLITVFFICKTVRMKLILCSFGCATIYMYYVLHIISTLCSGVQVPNEYLLGFIIMIMFILLSMKYLALKWQFYLFRAVFSFR